MNTLDQLLEKRVIVCAGTGGVGKTTLSASLAVAGAQAGKKVLVLTIDPAKRLATALGIDQLGSEDRRVPNQKFKGELYAAVVDSKYVFDSFVKKSLPSAESPEKILNNRIYQKLSTSLSGSQEFTALERFLMSYKAGGYDLVILDTPPAGHAMDFLDGAAKLEALFEESVLKWFVRPFQKQGFIGQMVHRSTNIAFSALERLTGAEFLKEIFEFFNVIYVLKDPLLQEVREIQNVLQSQNTAFVIVSGFDAAKLEEAGLFYEYLNNKKYQLGALIVNRCLPNAESLLTAKPSPTTEDSFKKAKAIYIGLKQFYQRHAEELNRLMNQIGRDVLVLRVEDSDQDIWDLPGLEKMAQRLKGLA